MIGTRQHRRFVKQRSQLLFDGPVFTFWIAKPSIPRKAGLLKGLEPGVMASVGLFPLGCKRTVNVRQLTSGKCGRDSTMIRPCVSLKVGMIAERTSSQMRFARSLM